MKLLLERYTYTQIDRTSVEGKRLYECPDGSKVPSVTTILSATQPIEKIIALENWRKAVGEKKAAEITTEAANRGTRMHKYLEDYIALGELKQPGSNPYAKQSHIMAETIINNGFTNINEIWGSEIGLYYPELYAGTSDAIGVHNGSPAIFDYKQTNKPKSLKQVEDYFLQLVFYGTAHNKLYGTNIRKGVVLMCVKPPETTPGKWGTPQYQEFIIDDKWDEYESKMWDRVAQYYNVDK